MGRLGYWQSAWPVECGGNRRPKTAPGAGFGLTPTDHLIATTRHTGRWPVMFVQRDHGELYLHGTTAGNEPMVAGWVERVDPGTLEPTHRSGDLPTGGHEWCGSLAAHRNGDLYTVNGSRLHRLSPNCDVLAELELPVDHAHNGMLILTDGSILTKDIRVGNEPSTLTVCSPDLEVMTTVRLPEPSMGRLAVVGGGDPSSVGGSTNQDGDTIYVPGTERILRYHWDGRTLQADDSWCPSYRTAGRGGMAWDVTVVDGRVWLMDNGDIPGVIRRVVDGTRHSPNQSPDEQPGAGASTVLFEQPDWTEPIRATGVATSDATEVLQVLATELPAGWVIAPPLVHDGVVVLWDTGNTGVAAFDVGSGGPPEMLWFQPFRNSMQPLLFPESGELIMNDFRLLAENVTSDDLVVLDFRTGQMKARVPTGSTRMNGMFLTPGWDRDVYYCSLGTVARVQARSLRSR